MKEKIKTEFLPGNLVTVNDKGSTSKKMSYLMEYQLLIIMTALLKLEGYEDISFKHQFEGAQKIYRYKF